ncbi:hypothetical protein C8R47DRAFT_1064468 [Mycena vitilis]|nr:hypothetical protein C8R47DRAFT_1064468 [Mycena vitilis]
MSPSFISTVRTAMKRSKSTRIASSPTPIFCNYTPPVRPALDVVQPELRASLNDESAPPTPDVLILRSFRRMSYTQTAHVHEPLWMYVKGHHLELISKTGNWHRWIVCIWLVSGNNCQSVRFYSPLAGRLRVAAVEPQSRENLSRIRSSCVFSRDSQFFSQMLTVDILHSGQQHQDSRLIRGRSLVFLGGSILRPLFAVALTAWPLERLHASVEKVPNGAVRDNGVATPISQRTEARGSTRPQGVATAVAFINRSWVFPARGG